MRKQDDVMRTYGVVAPKVNEGGPGSAGQSGDTQGLPDIAEADSESVMELVEEGQAFEAGVLLGVEGVSDSEVSEVHTKQIPEDDVPDAIED